jgi:hypothetical protein
MCAWERCVWFSLNREVLFFYRIKQSKSKSWKMEYWPFKKWSNNSRTPSPSWWPDWSSCCKGFPAGCTESETPGGWPTAEHTHRSSGSLTEWKVSVGNSINGEKHELDSLFPV